MVCPCLCVYLSSCLLFVTIVPMLFVVLFVPVVVVLSKVRGKLQLHIEKKLESPGTTYTMQYTVVAALTNMYRDSKVVKKIHGITV